MLRLLSTILGNEILNMILKTIIAIQMKGLRRKDAAIHSTAGITICILKR